MGTYDDFLSSDEKTCVQLKNGECCMMLYRVGDPIDDPGFQDGIYIGLEGFVVIKSGEVVVVTQNKEELSGYENLPIFSKWGGEISLDDDIEEISPFYKAVKDLAEQFQK